VINWELWFEICFAALIIYFVVGMAVLTIRVLRVSRRHPEFWQAKLNPSGALVYQLPFIIFIEAFPFGAGAIALLFMLIVSPPADRLPVWIAGLACVLIYVPFFIVLDVWWVGNLRKLARRQATEATL
jgi:hypothetical protein